MSQTLDGPVPGAAATGIDVGALHPVTGRPARRREIAVLMAASCMPILGAVLLAPVLPTLQRAFAGTPGVDALAPLVLTAPALMIALLAPVAGRIVDAVGRKRLLVGALAVYAVLGTAPVLLDSLPAVLATRIGVGITEAAIMTCCTTLIADYSAGARRAKLFGLQTIATTLSATVFFALGGALGSSNWQTPFYLYLLALPLAVLAAVLLWTPTVPPRATTALPPLPWRRMLVPLAVSLVGGVVFYTPIVELSYVLDSLGVTATAAIGGIAAVASLATAAGAASFPRIAARGPRFLLPLAFGLAGLGLVVLGLAPAVPVAVVGAVIASAGTGIMLPSLLTWVVGGLALEERGRGTGRWTAALFLGEFLCPLLVIAISGALSGIAAAVAVVGGISVLIAVVVRQLRLT
ncbi:Predicted arabinose efflux permease, MFS family [Klenkia soli]|uniref:Predicted arabinose efflux permease, MFS family n=1 Tax=Klenkia soli TaxID=1052260 RepID=A0A1H0U0M5_9ACTN|nr:MFS transporter [Klenkia soli]SDP59807.1 Predicted arabinose efflux permease, MFS family [Klenkia soli]